MDRERKVDSWVRASELITDPSEKGTRLCPPEISRVADHRTTSLAEAKLLSPLFVKLMHINYYKIVKWLKLFKILIVAATRFGLHKPSSGSSQPVLR